MIRKVSFIIPALNEEHQIAELIDNIKMLDNKFNYEIIVSDGHSSDNTAEIAKKKGAIVTKDNVNGPKTIANGRNSGANIATGDIYIFCDADTIMKDPNGFLNEIFSVFENPKIIGGAPGLSIFPHERIFKDKIFHFFLNNIVRFSFKTKVPLCGGQCQVVRKESFWSVNGYNINIVHGEDSDFFKRLRKIGSLHYFNKHEVYESPRRYRHYGYISLLIISVYSLVYQQIFKKNAFKEWRRIDWHKN